MYGEKAGVMGESPGYDLQPVLMSLGFDELGLASADIQLVTPCCPYSYARVPDAPEGTLRQCSALRTPTQTHRAPGRGKKLTLGIRGIALAP